MTAATNAKDLLLRISALSGTELVAGKTLVFLDEIQECEDLLTWVKFLEEQSRCDFILSGSLLGLDSFPARSLPVGFLSVLTVYPMDFEDFCWAMDVPSSLFDEAINAISQSDAVPDYLYELLMDTFYKYLLIGGMPNAVQAFADSSDLQCVRSIQDGISNLYAYDISKYVTDKVEARQIRMVYESIPGQLNSQNKRFKYTRLGKNLRFANLETAFDWLGHAGVGLITTKVGEPTFPLLLSEDPSSLKLCMNDVGLLMSYLAPGASLEILNRRSAINFGSIFENAAAQALAKQVFDLHFFNNTSAGEIDFVLQTNLGGHSPVRD